MVGEGEGDRQAGELRGEGGSWVTRLKSLADARLAGRGERRVLGLESYGGSWGDAPGRCEMSRARAPETIGQAIEVPDIYP